MKMRPPDVRLFAVRDRRGESKSSTLTTARQMNIEKKQRKKGKKEKSTCMLKSVPSFACDLTRQNLTARGFLAVNPSVHYHNCRLSFPLLTPRNLRIASSSAPRRRPVRALRYLGWVFVETPAFRRNQILLQAIVSRLKF
jgi:hypothetical protein